MRDMAPEEELITEEFRMTSAKFVGEMIFRHGWAYLLTLSLLGVAGIALGVAVDYRWFIIVLMLLFLVAPLLLALLYFYFGLRREAYVNTMPHTVAADDRGLTFNLRMSDLSDLSDESDKSDRSNNSECREEFFPYSSMTPMQVGLKSVSIPLKSPAKGFLWVPVAAFVSDDKASAFLLKVETEICRANNLPLPER